MTQEQTIRSFYEAIGNHDVDKILTFFADDGQFNDKASEHVYRGKKEIRSMCEGWFKALPDVRMKVTNVIGSGDLYCAEFSLNGTHSGPFTGPAGEIPATGKKVNVPSCDVINFKNGKIQSLNCYFAATVLLGQIGALPGARKAA